MMEPPWDAPSASGLLSYRERARLEADVRDHLGLVADATSRVRVRAWRLPNEDKAHWKVKAWRQITMQRRANASR